MFRLAHILFGIEYEEIKPALFCFLLSFIWGITQVLTLTAANTLFLNNFSAAQLPYIYIFNAVLIPVIGLIFIRISKRISFVKFFFFVCLFFIICLVFFRLLLFYQQEKSAGILLLIWYEIEFTLTGILIWGVVGRLFTVRQSKRLYSPITIGSDIAVIIFGLLTSILSKSAGINNFVLITLFTHFSAILVFYIIFRTYGKRLNTAYEKEKIAEEDEDLQINLFRLIINNKFIFGIAAVAVFSTINYYFTDNAFYREAQINISGTDDLAGLIGKLLAAISFVTILTNGFITGRIIKKTGISGGLLITPVIMGVVVLLFIISSLLNLTSNIILSIIILVKIFQTVLMETVNINVFFNLLQTLPSQEKNTVSIFSETLISPIFGGISGGLLLIINQIFHFGPVGICIVLECIMIFWIVISVYTGKKYQKNLSESLERKRLSGESLPVNDPNLEKILLGNLSHSNPLIVVYSIDLLNKINSMELYKHLQQLSTHPDSLVRKKVAEEYEKIGKYEDYDYLYRWFKKEADIEVKASVIKALAFTNELDSYDILASLTNAINKDIRMAAINGLIRYCGIEGIIHAGSEIKNLSLSESKEDRVFAAECIGNTELTNIYSMLIPLLKDDDYSVRKAAIQSAGILLNQKLLPGIIENIMIEPLQGVIINTLVQFGDTVFPALEELFYKKNQTQKIRILIINIYGRKKGNLAIALLKKKLIFTGYPIIYESLAALLLCGYEPDQNDKEAIEKLLNETHSYIVRIIKVMVILSDDKNDFRIVEALEEEMTKYKKLLFLILSFLYDQSEIRNIQFNYFNKENEDKKDLAVELLGNLLSRAHGPLILPVMEDIPLKEKLLILISLNKNQSMEKDAVIREIIQDETFLQNNWLKITAFNYLSLIDKNKVLNEINYDNLLYVIESTMVLKKADIFKDIAHEDLMEITRYTEKKHFKAGEKVFSYGEIGDSMYFIAKGKVYSHIGQKTILELVDDGMFGELSALIPEPNITDVTCLTDTSLICINRSKLYQIIEDNMEITKSIISALCRKFKDLDIPLKEKKIDQEDENSNERLSYENKNMSQLDKMMILKSVNLFSGLPDDILLELSALVKEYNLYQGQTLFKKNDFGHSMYIIVEGSMKVHDGDIFIARLGSGQIIGELAALSMERRSASITALSYGLLFKITGDSLYSLIWEHRTVARSMIEILVRRIRARIK